MFELIVGIVCVVGLLFLRPKKPYSPPTCRKCGLETVYLEGMGAGVDMCPKCDVL
jgi:hypothetical protein